MYREYEDDQEYEEQRDDRADRLYDEMRDDFLMIENEEDAKNCIKRYGPLQTSRFLPNEYKYLLEEDYDEV